MGVVDFAYEVLEMQQTIADLRRELYRLRNIEEQYNTLLNESLAHGQAMMGNWLKLALIPGVSKAITEHAETTHDNQHPSK